MAEVGEVHLHFVVQGRGCVLSGGGFRARVAPSSLVLIPPRVKHRIEPEGIAEHEVGVHEAICHATPTGFDEVIAGEGPPGLVMTCGRLTATYGGVLGLFDQLREPLVESFADLPDVRSLFDQLLREQDAGVPGAARMTRALMEQCLIHLFRRLHGRQEKGLPWLAAFGHPGFARVVHLILSDPAAPHTLDSLAAVAGMSRSAFSEHFHAAFGRSAVELLRETRLRLGARLLQTSDLPVKAIASRVGYSSRSHFSRAFKHAYGSDPARFRAAE